MGVSMTWHFDVEGTDLLIWDHTQDPASDGPHQTLTADDGWTWTDYPDEILGVMYQDVRSNIQGNSPANQRALWVLLDGAFERIERYEPDQ